MDATVGSNRFGDRRTIGGVVAVATFVALPVGTPLSAVFSRWIHASDEITLAAGTTIVVWFLLLLWLLHGIREQVRFDRHVDQLLEGGARNKAPGSQGARPAHGIAAGLVDRHRPEQAPRSTSAPAPAPALVRGSLSSHAALR